MQLKYKNLRNRDADRYLFSVSYIRALSGPGQAIVFAGAYGGLEDEQNNLFPQFGREFYGGRFGMSTRIMSISPNLRGFVNLNVEQREYNGPHSFFLVDQNDTQLIATVGMEYELFEDWSVIPEVNIINNDSNVPVSDFDRIIAGVRVRFRF